VNNVEMLGETILGTVNVGNPSGGRNTVSDPCGALTAFRDPSGSKGGSQLLIHQARETGIVCSTVIGAHVPFS